MEREAAPGCNAPSQQHNARPGPGDFSATH